MMVGFQGFENVSPQLMFNRITNDELRKGTTSAGKKTIKNENVMRSVLVHADCFDVFPYISDKKRKSYFL